MSSANFQRLLKDLVGLDAEAIGPSAIERAVKERQSLGRCADASVYWESLQSSDTERQLLVEAVVVPETWFFRDRGAFEGLSQFAVSELQTAHSERVLRILSVPCSSGEEPYSIAMTLKDAGLLPRQYQIDAVDVSRNAIAKGLRGIYGDNSFRGDDTSFRDRHFLTTGNGFQLLDEIRKNVAFRQGNLLSPDFLVDAEPYDVIFCRNLFIYFDRPTQHRAVAALTRLLARDGMLFVAPSETGVFMDRDFTPANLPRAFAFRRKVEAAPTIARQPALSARHKARPVVAPAPARPQPEHRPPAAEPPVTMEKAYQLADQGHFAEAAKVCDDHIRREGPSARAFYLLGLVRDASGNESDAESFYRKTLYLDPAHREALVHLALLMERKGDPSGAQVLRNRVRRLESVSGVVE